MRTKRHRIDDVEVTLAFYGSIVYLAVVSALGSQSKQPTASTAISAVVATATVLYIAHVFAALVPKAARAGRLRGHDLLKALEHDVWLLVAALVPIVPLALAAAGAVELDTGYTLSVRLSIALLFGLAVTLSRRDGLSWARALVAGLAIIAVAVVVIYLESHVH
jgi:hypothetical protein